MGNKIYVQEETEDVTVEWEGEPYTFTRRKAISWAARKALLSKCVVISGKGEISMDIGQLVDALWDAMIVKAPFPKTDMFRIDARFGALVESKVLPSVSEIFGTGLSKEDAKN